MATKSAFYIAWGEITSLKYRADVIFHFKSHAMITKHYISAENKMCMQNPNFTILQQKTNILHFLFIYYFKGQML